MASEDDVKRWRDSGLVDSRLWLKGLGSPGLHSGQLRVEGLGSRVCDLEFRL